MVRQNRRAVPSRGPKMTARDKSMSFIFNMLGENGAEFVAVGKAAIFAMHCTRVFCVARSNIIGQHPPICAPGCASIFGFGCHRQSGVYFVVFHLF